MRTFKGEGLIAAIDNGQIILNVGGKAGIKVGDVLEVTRVTPRDQGPRHGEGLAPSDDNGGNHQGNRCGRSLGDLHAGDWRSASRRAIMSPSPPTTLVSAVTGWCLSRRKPTSASPAASSGSSSSQASPSNSPAAAGQGNSGSDQPNFSAIKAEFLPGEKTVFFDDFSDMAGDDAPPHWKIRGATPELRVAGSTARAGAHRQPIRHLSPTSPACPRTSPWRWICFAKRCRWRWRLRVDQLVLSL